MAETDALLLSDAVHMVPNIKRKRKQRSYMIMTLGLTMLALLFGGMMVVKNASEDPDSEAAAILSKAFKAKAKVFKGKDGDYHVKVDVDSITPDTTFSELAATMIHPWYEASIMAVYDDPAWESKEQIDPFNVKPIRNVMRTARTMLDIFSPVFPDAPVTHGNPNKDHSLWRELRKMYKKGYNVMGDLQDLFDVDYSKKTLKQRRKKVLKWRKEFMWFMESYRIRRYLYSDYSTGLGGIDPVGHYLHRSSHLYWRDIDIDRLPHGGDSGTDGVRALGKIMMERSQGFLNTIHNYKTILPETHEIMFHNLRKQIRIFLIIHDILGDLLVPDVEDKDDDDKAEPTAVERAFDIFEELVDRLGDINDIWMAVELYVNEGYHKKEAAKLTEEMDDRWLDFLDWQVENKLNKTLIYVYDQMDEA